MPVLQAVKIALEVKKWLVDNDKLDVTQDELEAVLFSSMRAKGFGDEHVRLYRMVNSFQQSKRPLIILICGAPATGKSAMAQALSSRLNLPNVLQADVLRDLLAGEKSTGCPLPLTPLWVRDNVPGDRLISEFQGESRVMRRALDGDLTKCVTDGKSIIIEGFLLDPGLYLNEFGPGGSLHARAGTIMTAEMRSPNIDDGKASKSSPFVVSDESTGNIGVAYSSTPKQWSQNKLRSGNGAADRALPHRVVEGLHRSTDIDEGLAMYGDPVFVPLVLSMHPEEYTVMADAWLQSQGGGAMRAHALTCVLKLQEYLTGYGESGVLVVRTGMLRFQETLDKLHDHILRCIDESMNNDADAQRRK